MQQLTIAYTFSIPAVGELEASSDPARETSLIVDLPWSQGRVTRDGEMYLRPCVPSRSAVTLPLKSTLCVIMPRKTPSQQDCHPVIVGLKAPSSSRRGCSFAWVAEVPEPEQLTRASYPGPVFKEPSP